MTPVFLSDSFWLHFGTSSPTTGAATNADSTPTVTVAKDGTDLGYTPTVSNVATGLYKVQIDATTGNGFAAGQRYSVYVAATVGGVTGRDGIGEFEVLAVDLNTGVAAVSGLTPGNLDVAVSSRLATAGYSAPPSAASIRAEIDSNSTKLDVAVSTRLATAGYTAPDNSSISTILGRVDVATSTRLAAASYSAPPSAAAIRAEIDANSTKLDVAVSSRLASGSVTLSASEYAAIADKILGRNLAGNSDGGRTVQDALRASRNKTAIAGATLTVYAEDDATPAWTATVATASRDALASIDPA